MSSRGALPGVLIALLLGSTRATAASPPQPINDLAVKASLEASDKARIDEYATYWLDQLAGSDPAEIAKARSELLRPLRSPDVRQPFRFAMTDSVLPKLTEVLDGDNIQATYNAMQVVGLLGTPKALDVILLHCDGEHESRYPLRLLAAKAFEQTLLLATLSPNDITRGVRALGAAAGHEEEWLPLRRQFEAMARVNTDVA